MNKATDLAELTMILRVSGLAFQGAATLSPGTALDRLERVRLCADAIQLLVGSARSHAADCRILQTQSCKSRLPIDPEIIAGLQEGIGACVPFIPDYFACLMLDEIVAPLSAGAPAAHWAMELASAVEGHARARFSFDPFGAGAGW